MNMARIVVYIEKVLDESYRSAHYKDRKEPMDYLLGEINGQLILFFDGMYDTHTCRRIEYRLENNFEKNFKRKLGFAGDFGSGHNIGGFTPCIDVTANARYCYDNTILPIMYKSENQVFICQIQNRLEPRLDEDWEEYKKLPVAKFLTPNFFNRIPESNQEVFPNRTFCKIDSDLWYNVHDKLMDEYRDGRNMPAFGYLYDTTSWQDFCYAWNLAYGYFPKAIKDFHIISQRGNWSLIPVKEDWEPSWKVTRRKIKESAN